MSIVQKATKTVGDKPLKPVLVDPTPLLRAIAIDHEDVFVTSYGPKLIAINHANTFRRELVPEAGPACDLVVADPAGVYVTADDAVWQVDKATGKLTKLAPFAGVSSLALDPRFVYTTLRGSYPGYADGGLVRIARDGGASEWLVQGRGAYAVCVAGSRIYFASDGQLWRREADGAVSALWVRLAGNAQRLWWFDDVDGGLYMLPIA